MHNKVSVYSFSKKIEEGKKYLTVPFKQYIEATSEELGVAEFQSKVRQSIRAEIDKKLMNIVKEGFAKKH